MDAVATGLWSLADEQERRGDYGRAIKCLESICQSNVSFLPMIEIKTRIRLADLLISHTHNLNHARAHLERANLLLKSTPSCFDLKCRAHSLLSHCYNLIGTIPAQRLILHKALELVNMDTSASFIDTKLWGCNFYSQLAAAAVIEEDYDGALNALQNGFAIAVEFALFELQMYFATMLLHLNLLEWKDVGLVREAIRTCNQVWESIHPDQRQVCLGLFFYNELLQTFYLLRLCDYSGANEHVEKLDAAMKNDLQLAQRIEELLAEYDTVKRNLSRTNLHSRERSALSLKYNQLHEQLNATIKPKSSSNDLMDQSLVERTSRAWRDKLPIAPPPIDGEWIPKRAVYALVDLMVVMMGRPKGLFKDCERRIQSGLLVINEELTKLGINSSATEVDLKRSDIWIGGLYLTLLMQFLENKIAVELTRSEFVEAREALIQMIDWYVRFPTMLQGCESIIEMLRGLYAHSLGCLNEAIFHFTEATKLAESKSMQTMCEVYAAVSYISIGDAESTSQALDLVGPVYRVMDSFAGVREKTCIMFVYGLLLMKQHNLQESRHRLAKGLKIAHQHLGNIQLVSQFLTVLGTLALQLHDTAQAREILKSALTLAKTLYDIPTQIWVLSVLTDLYKELGNRGNEMENAEYERDKEDDLQKKLSEAQSSAHHLELVEKSRVKAKVGGGVQLQSAALCGPPTNVDLDIPESIDLPTITTSMSSVTRLRDGDSLLKRVTRSQKLESSKTSFF